MKLTHYRLEAIVDGTKVDLIYKDQQEMLNAHEELRKRNISAQVVDIYE